MVVETRHVGAVSVRTRPLRVFAIERTVDTRIEVPAAFVR